VWWVVNALPSSGLLSLRERPFIPTVKETVRTPGPVWTGAENLFSTGIRSPDRYAHSESLYRLSYPGLPSQPDPAIDRKKRTGRKSHRRNLGKPIHFIGAPNHLQVTVSSVNRYSVSVSVYKTNFYRERQVTFYRLHTGVTLGVVSDRQLIQCSDICYYIAPRFDI
jgi:hypothetical protein